MVSVMTAGLCGSKEAAMDKLWTDGCGRVPIKQKQVADWLPLTLFPS